MADDHNEPDPADARVQAAAQWLLDQPHFSSVVPALRQRFGLSTAEAINAIRACEQMRRAAT